MSSAIIVALIVLLLIAYFIYYSNKVFKNLCYGQWYADEEFANIAKLSMYTIYIDDNMKQAYLIIIAKNGGILYNNTIKISFNNLHDMSKEIIDVDVTFAGTDDDIDEELLPAKCKAEINTSKHTMKIYKDTKIYAVLNKIHF